MITANQWYNIAKTTNAGSKTGIRVELGGYYALLVVEVDFGSVVITAAESNINPNDVKVGARIRYNNGAWFADVRISKAQDGTLSASLYNNNGWGTVAISTSTPGTTVCLINDIMSQIPTRNGESLFELINIGTTTNPKYAVVPKDFNGRNVHIMSYGDILAGGQEEIGGSGGNTTTLGGLNNVEDNADEMFNTDKVLVKTALNPHWIVVDLSSIVGLDVDALNSYLIQNNYATITDVNNAIQPVSDKVNSFDERIDTLENLGLTIKERNGKKYLESEYDFIGLGDIVAGGGEIGEGEDKSGTLGSLYNVDSNVDEVYPTDKVLIKSANKAHWSAFDLSAIVGLDTAALQRYLDNNKYITESALNGYATADSVNALRTDFDNLNALLNDDTSGVIDTWNEVVDFLNGYKESEDLATILSGMNTEIGKKADKTDLDILAAKLNELGLRIETIDGVKYLFSANTFVSEKDVIAGGIGEEGPTSGGSIQQVYGASAFGGTFDAANLTDTFNAHAINSLYTTIQRGVKNPYALTINGTPYDGSSPVDITISGGGGGVSGDYLPLTGGTITGILAVENDGWSPILLKRGGTTAFIGSAVNLLQLGFNEGYLNIGINELTYASSGNLYNIIHTGNFNPADYLPKSGGIVDTLHINTSSTSEFYSLYINNNNAACSIIKLQSASVNRADIGWYDSVGVYINNNISNKSIGIKDDGTPFYDSHTLIHSGNIGSQSVSYASSAEVVTGSVRNPNLNYSMYDNTIRLFSLAGGGNGATEWGGGVSIISDYCGFQLQVHNYWSSVANIQARIINENGWSSWRGLAFLDDNVASATKLQTARTIWGQSFDGTGDVWGRIGIRDSAALYHYTPDGSGLLCYIGHDYVNPYAHLYNFRSGSSIRVNDDGNICVPNGNVLIGTTTDNGAKLQVNGSFTAQGTKIHEWNVIETIDNSNLYVNYFNTSNVVLCNGGGNVLMGTTSDNGNKLQVNGTIDGAIFTSKTRSSASVNTSGCFRWGSFDEGAGGFKMQFGGPDSTLTILDYQWTKGLFMFQSTGNFTATGDITAGSDARYKSKLQDIAIDVQTIAEAPLFNYQWNDREDKDVHLGTTAQYWMDTNFKDAVNANNPDFYHLNYGALATAIGITVAKKVVNHEERIAVLERENKELREELKQYRRLS